MHGMCPRIFPHWIIIWPAVLSGSTGQEMRIEKNWKALIIDDDPGVLKVTAIALEDAGYAVITAPDGESGLDLCIAESPDVIITDIRMPGIDGIEVLRRIKQIDPGKEVIVTTAFSDINHAIRALQLDASDFITKPISEQALMIAIKRARERYVTRKELQESTATIRSRGTSRGYTGNTALNGESPGGRSSWGAGDLQTEKSFPRTFRSC